MRFSRDSDAAPAPCGRVGNTLFRFHAEVLQAEVERRFDGSLAALAERIGCDRATLWRWCAGVTLPRDETRFLRLASAVDLDPLALWELPLQHFPTLLRHLVRSHERSPRRPGAHAGLLDEYLAPSGAWPPPRVAAAFGRAWCVRDLAHDATAQRDCYATLRLAPEGVGPRVWHFGTLDRSGPVVARLRPLGFVFASSTGVALFARNGIAQLRARPDGVGHDCSRVAAQPLDVEVWLGHGAALVRVASLHRFELARVPGAYGAPLRFCKRAAYCAEVESCGARDVCAARLVRV